MHQWYPSDTPVTPQWQPSDPAMNPLTGVLKGIQRGNSCHPCHADNFTPSNASVDLHLGPRAKHTMQEPNIIPIHAKPGTKSHARSKSQGTRAKDQEPKTKSHKDHEPRRLQYSGLPPTDFLKQILITQKMHAPNIFFAKIPQFGRLHACLTSLKNIPIVYTDLCNVWIGSSSCLHGNTMKPNVQAAGYIYIYIYGNASRTFEQLAKKWWCSETPMD